MSDSRARPTQIVLPQLAESVVTATIAKWLKRPGDEVMEFEPLCEIVTDKVTVELPSTLEGMMGEVFVAEGQTVEVGTVICTVLPKDAPQFAGMAGASGGPAAAEPATGAGEGLADGIAGMRGRYSPAVRRLAEEHGIDLAMIRGTGIGGRVTRKDVLRFLGEREAGAVAGHGAASLARDGTAASASTSAGAAAAASTNGWSAGAGVFSSPGSASASSMSAARTAGPSIHGSGPAAGYADMQPRPAVEWEDGVEPGEPGSRGEYYINVTPVRHTIASRMRQSVAEIPHAWLMVEVDVTNLVELRTRLKEEFLRREGINLTYLAFVLKAVVNAIKDYPIVNSVWAVDKIIVKRDINISLAVGTEEAVYTPVIKQADQKNIAGLAREIDELTKKARSGRLTPADMQGGTFTVNNTGSFGSIMSQPIINYPQAVNLTFESIVKKPVVIGDMIAIRHMANMCLSLDHRILDGLICGRFLQRVKENIESFDRDTKLY